MSETPGSVSCFRSYDVTPALTNGVASGSFRVREVGWQRRSQYLVGCGTLKRGYLVDTTAAVDLLENVNQLAAGWWRTNTPDLLKPGACLLFEEECCVVEDPSATC